MYRLYRRWTTDFLCSMVKPSASVGQRQELAGHNQAAQLSAQPLKTSDRAVIILKELEDSPIQSKGELLDKVFVKTGMLSTSANSKVLLLVALACCYLTSIPLDIASKYLKIMFNAH